MRVEWSDNRMAGGGCDLSEFATALTTTNMLVLHISEDEYRALRDVSMYTDAQEAIVADAVYTGDEVLLSASYAEFDMLAGNIAFEVNHGRGRKQIVLNELSEQIEMLLRRADRGPIP